MVDADIRKQSQVLEKRTLAMKTALATHIVEVEMTEAKDDAVQVLIASPALPGARVVFVAVCACVCTSRGSPPPLVVLIIATYRALQADATNSPVLDALAELHDARRRAAARERAVLHARQRTGSFAGGPAALPPALPRAPSRSPVLRPSTSPPLPLDDAADPGAPSSGW